MEEQAKKLLAKIEQGKNLYSILRKEIEVTLEFNGRTLKQWKEKFSVKIELDNVNPTVLKEISARLILLNQEASFNYNLAATKRELIISSTAHTFDDEYMQILEVHKTTGTKPPAAPTLKVMANKKNSTLTMAATIAEIEMKFWKTVLESLQTSRKLVDTATLNTSVELKALTNDKIMEGMLNKTNGTTHNE